MGKRQSKKRIFLRTCWLVAAILTTDVAFSQKIDQPVYLQNAFYYEIDDSEDEETIIISENTIEACDSLTSALRPYFLKENGNLSTILWKLTSYLSFDYEDGVFCIVKVKEMQDSLVKGVKSYTLFKRNNCWESREVKDFDNIRYAIQVLKTGTLHAFYTKENSPNESIDKIKNDFKDVKGILDINKLGLYLKKRPLELKEFCDY